MSLKFVILLRVLRKRFSQSLRLRIEARHTAKSQTGDRTKPSFIDLQQEVRVTCGNAGANLSKWLSMTVIKH